jgi:hypothetical protein
MQSERVGGTVVGRMLQDRRHPIRRKTAVFNGKNAIQQRRPTDSTQRGWP